MNGTLVKSFSINVIFTYDFVNILLLDVVLIASSLRQGGKSDFSHLMWYPCCPILDEHKCHKCPKEISTSILHSIDSRDPEHNCI